MRSIRPLTDADRDWVRARCVELYNGERVVSRGVLHAPAELPGFVAVDDGERFGIATYQIAGDACELVTIDAFHPWRGVGTALLAAVEEAAHRAGARRVWLITTNDNVDALRFYQRRGYRIVAVYPDALEESRRLKPTIPPVGSYGIPMRDEIELEKATPA